MPKINQKEYEILKELDDKWKWIARTRWSRVYIYDHKPWKESAGWVNYNRFYRLNDDLFQFIQWEDESPYNIAELIEEYESEEIEVNKDVEWLKENITKNIKEVKGENYLTDFGKEHARTIIGTYEVVLDLINQLDEPEVLSSDWMDKKRLINRVENYIPLHDKTVGDVINGILEIIKQLPELEVLSPEWIDENQHPYGGDYHVPSEKLEDILVPKQKKVEVPLFVADILEENTFAHLPTAFEELFSANAGHYYGEDVCEWIISNEEDFARAWLDGYVVEEEQKYYVLDNDLKPMLCRSAGLDNEIMESNSSLTINEKSLYREQYKLTEQEIKDYDERYFAFAKPVEELE